MAWSAKWDLVNTKLKQKNREVNSGIMNDNYSYLHNKAENQLLLNFMIKLFNKNLLIRIETKHIFVYSKLIIYSFWLVKYFTYRTHHY